MELYHGSIERVESPEIRIQNRTLIKAEEILK